MPMLADWKPSDPIQACVFGKYKLGKTAGALTFPRPVVFDFDKGIAVGRSPWFVQKYGVRPVWYDRFEDTQRVKGVVSVHAGFDRACLCFDEWMKASGTWTDYTGQKHQVGRDKFDTFIIDSGTTLSLLCMSKAAIVLGAQGLSKTQENAVKSGVLIPKQQDYGAERNLLEQIVRMVKDSNKNFILICHERENYKEDSNTIEEVVPLLTGKSQELVPLMFDEVYNLRIKPKGMEMFRYLQTQPDAHRRCGTRYGIPNETAWEYDALKAQIDKIYAEQQKQTASPAVVGVINPK